MLVPSSLSRKAVLWPVRTASNQYGRSREPAAVR